MIAVAQDSPPGPVQIGAATPPVLIYKVEPQYTEEARMARLVGSVIVSTTLTPEGLPTNFHIVRSLGLGLDEKASQALSGWRFRPGMKQGNPVEITASIEVNFRLVDDGGVQPDPRTWQLTRVAFGPSSPRPEIVTANYPSVAGPEGPAKVSLSFDVDEKGVPTNIVAVESSDRKWEAEAIAILGQWRFKPGMVGGKPTTIHAAMDFAHRN
jgi:TonB family protein